MTESQRREFVKTTRRVQPREFHHGDCVGADEEAHAIIWAMVQDEGLDCLIVIHPPTDEKFRAFCGVVRDPHVEIRAPKPYLERNHDIVDETEVLIATPGTHQEMTRSGTWATIRYARKRYHPIGLIEP